MASKGTPATALLTRQKIAFTPHVYAVSAVPGDSYGLAVAEALGVDAGRLFKTLVASVDGALVVGVVPVAGSLDLKALAAAVGGKRAAMAEPAAAERATGYVTGGISPLGQRSRLPVVVDGSATKWSTIYVSGGRRGLQIELAPGDLLAATGATTAAISSGR